MKMDFIHDMRPLRKLEPRLNCLVVMSAVWWYQTKPGKRTMVVESHHMPDEFYKGRSCLVRLRDDEHAIGQWGYSDYSDNVHHTSDYLGLSIGIDVRPDFSGAVLFLPASF